MGNEIKTKLPSHLMSRTALLCLAAICASRFSTTILNMGIYPEIADFFGIARELNTYSTVFFMIILVAVASKRPSIIDTKMFTALSVFLLIFGCVILAFALNSVNNALVLVGLISISAARSWFSIMIYATLASLRDKSAAIFAVSGGVLAGFLLYPVAALLSTVASVVIYCALPLCLIVPLYLASNQSMQKALSYRSPSEMKIMNPFSFLGPTHPILIAILLFNMASGFSLSLNIQQNTPLALSIIGAITVVVSIGILMRAKSQAIDRLFSLSLLLIIGGYIASVAFFGTSNPLANTILTAGATIFSMLVYLVISSAIGRNPVGMIPLAAWTVAFGSLGTAAGADLGHLINLVGIHNTQAAILAICAVLMLFVAYLWIGMRRFSFEEAINGVVSVSADDLRAIDDRFEYNIQEIAKRHGLTERETEILLLMAKGRNSVFLQDHLVVSKNTIKTHIKHIYQKLDVHSQQEVIDLIERER